jgi:hypothetical protein
MKWKVEYIIEKSNNILVDDPKKEDGDKEPVGLGFPVKLAERIVKMHNEVVDELMEKK